MENEQPLIRIEISRSLVANVLLALIVLIGPGTFLQMWGRFGVQLPPFDTVLPLLSRVVFSPWFAAVFPALAIAAVAIRLVLGNNRRTLYLNVMILGAMVVLSGLYVYGVHLVWQSWFEGIIKK